MPNANNWNNTTKTWGVVVNGQDKTVRLSTDDVFIDEKATLDKTNKNEWTATKGEETDRGKLTGTDTRKKDALVKLVQQHCFDFIIPLADLPLDDPDRTINPSSPREFWADADHNPDPAGLFYVSRADTIDFVQEDFANGILTAIQRRVK